MGIQLGEALRILEAARDRNIHGRALTLGKQDCGFGLHRLLDAMSQAHLYGASRNSGSPSAEQRAVIEEFSANGRLASGATGEGGEEQVSDEFFFRFIGFDAIQSIDHAVAGGAFEGATIAYDLNFPGLGAVAGENQLVYDGGTMEHVFNTANVFRNIFEALAVGGYVIHNSPTNNTVDHGFYQFSPTLFLDYYATNGFGDIEVYLTRGYSGRYVDKGAIEEYFGTDLQAHKVRYTQGLLSMVTYGGLDGAIYGTTCFARKLPASTWDRIPQQGVYVPLWDAAGNRAG